MKEYGAYTTDKDKRKSFLSVVMPKLIEIGKWENAKRSLSRSFFYTCLNKIQGINEWAGA